MFSFISGSHFAFSILIDLSQGRESFLSKAKLLLIASSSSASTVTSTTTAPTISPTTGRSVSFLSWWTVAFLSLTAFTIGSFAALAILPPFSATSTAAATSATSSTSTPRILVSEGEVYVQLFLKDLAGCIHGLKNVKLNEHYVITTDYLQ